MKVTRLIASAAVLMTVAAVCGQDDSPFEVPGLPNFGQPSGGSGDSSDRVRVTVKALADEVAQGSDLPVAIVFDIDPRWHIWTNQRPTPPGMASFEFAIHTEIEVTAPDDGPLVAHTDFIEWPEFHGVTADVGDGPQKYAVFEGRAIAYLPVTVPADAATGPASLTFDLVYQSCDDKVCLAPAAQTITLDVSVVPVGQQTTTRDDTDFAGFPADVFPRIRSGERAPSAVAFDLFGLTFSLDASTTTGFVLLLLVGALGGFLLNLTPCVLPVIPLKIMGLSQSASGSRAKTLALGVAMAAGVVGFWLVLGGLIAGLTGFTATNQLFQYPVFTITVGLFIAVMAIGMCGLFSIRLPKAVYMVNPSHETLHGSVLFGVMTAILSTPCTAPFMGAVAAWAALQPTAITLGAFAAIGGGMASPYLVLAAFPQLAHRMPRTGPASELIKQVMGLLMLAAAAYFVGVGLSGAMVTPPDAPSKAYFWVVGLLGTSAGLWLLWRTVRITKRAVPRVAWGGIGVLIAAISLGVAIRVTDKGPIAWVNYTPERFAEAKSEGNVVVMEFTAEWCLNCKQSDIVARLNGEGVVPIKVDLTGNNVDGNDMLEAVDRLTIPLLVVFRADGSEVFKGDYYTVDQVIDAIAQAEAQAVASSRP